jgi:hypothetical protein
MDLLEARQETAPESPIQTESEAGDPIDNDMVEGSDGTAVNAVEAAQQGDAAEALADETPSDAGTLAGAQSATESTDEQER